MSDALSGGIGALFLHYEDEDSRSWTVDEGERSRAWTI